MAVSSIQNCRLPIEAHRTVLLSQYTKPSGPAMIKQIDKYTIKTATISDPVINMEMIAFLVDIYVVTP